MNPCLISLTYIKILQKAEIATHLSKLKMKSIKKKKGSVLLFYIFTTKENKLELCLENNDLNIINLFGKWLDIYGVIPVIT